jgi:prephenate dehydrogenase
MTRIAGVDERIWTQLYMANRKCIQAELEGLIDNLSVYLNAIKNEDTEGLSDALREGRLIRETIKRGND